MSNNIDYYKIEKKKLVVEELKEGEKSYKAFDSLIDGCIGATWVAYKDFYMNCYEVYFDETTVVQFGKASATNYRSWRNCYSYIGMSCEGYRLVQSNDSRLWGYLDVVEKNHIPCQFRYASNFTNGFARVIDEDWKEYFIDKKLERYSFAEVKEICSKINSHSEDLVRRAEEYKKQDYDNVVLGYYDQYGFIVVGSEGHDFTEHVGCMDAQGNYVIPNQYINNIRFHEDVAAIDTFFKRGYINPKGENIVPLGKYNKVRAFKNDRGAVCDYEGKWGFVDKNGKEVVKCQYDAAEDFGENGFARVFKDGEWKYIDKYDRSVLYTTSAYHMPNLPGYYWLSLEDLKNYAKEHEWKKEIADKIIADAVALDEAEKNKQYHK